MGAKKAKISITIDEDSLTNIDALARHEVRTRSQMIEVAVREYVHRNPLPQSAAASKVPKKKAG